MKPDQDFRDFVAGFGAPLARLSYLLVATETRQGPDVGHSLAVNALAAVRRRWRHLESIGAPEPLAIEELLRRLPRRLCPTTQTPADDQGAGSGADWSADSGAGLGAEQDVDAAIRAAVERAYLRLAPRQRVAFVFADPAVASPRLAGLDVPASFGSQRRQARLTADGIQALRATLDADPLTRDVARTTSDAQLMVIVVGALGPLGARATPPSEANAQVQARGRRVRHRGALAAGMGVALVGVVVAAAVAASEPPKAPRPLLTLPARSIERGQPDPSLLTQALAVAAGWTPPNPATRTHPVVLWGGIDAVGTNVLVTRVRAKGFDLVIVEWSGDAPGLYGQYLVDSTSPQVPFAFAYRGLDGTRVGVIAPPQAVRAELDVQGQTSPTVPISATGFASIPISGRGGLPSAVDPDASPPPSNEAVGLLDVPVGVDLLDASGQRITTMTVPPAS